MIKIFLLISIVLSVCLCIPSTFDVRVQPSSLYTSHTSPSEPICQAYRWAHRLAQIVGNSFAIKNKQAIQLSGRQIVQCLNETLNDICAETTLENIINGIEYVNKTGITLQSCYRNRYLEAPGKFCKINCDNGQKFIRTVTPIIVEEPSFDYISSKIGKGTYTAFAIVGLYDQMKYYSSENQEHIVAQGDFYGYTLGQIVGWKKGGDTITISLGGPGWGFKGYANVPKNSKLIHKVYSVFYDSNKPRPSSSSVNKQVSIQ